MVHQVPIETDCAVDIQKLLASAKKELLPLLTLLRDWQEVSKDRYFPEDCPDCKPLVERLGFRRHVRSVVMMLTRLLTALLYFMRGPPLKVRNTVGLAGRASRCEDLPDFWCYDQLDLPLPVQGQGMHDCRSPTHGFVFD